MRFVHYSHTGGLTRLDPAYHGTGIAGTEKRVAREYPVVPRLYAYHTKHTRDSKLPTYVYTGDIPDRLVLEAGSTKAKAYGVSADELVERGYARFDVRARVEIETGNIQQGGYHAIDTGRDGIIILQPVGVTELPRDAMKEIVKLHNSEGGCTYNLNRGNMVGTPGYAVCMRKAANVIIPDKLIKYEHVVSFVVNNPELTWSDLYSVGTWYDAEIDRTDIDLIAVVPNVDWALEIGAHQHQKAIFNLADMVTIPVEA